MKKLTERQKLFADEYLIDLNATRAYRTIYTKVKNDHVAAQSGSRLLKNENVKSYINKRMEDRSRRTEITQDMVLREMAKIGFANLQDYLIYHTKRCVVGYEKESGEPIVDYAQVVEVIDSKEVDTSVVQEISVTKEGKFTFKLYDKQKALDQMARHLGMFKDRIEIDGVIPVVLTGDDSIAE